MPTLSKPRNNLRPSVFAELQGHIDAFARGGGDLIGLHLGDTYLEPPQAARLGATLAPLEDAALYRYGAVGGLMSLREAIAEDLRRRKRAFPGVVGAAHVMVGAGATHALFCAAQAILEPGDEVLLAAPYWPLAHGIIVASGATPVEVPFTSRLYGDPTLDAGAILRAALTPRTKAIYLITPNNPDGKMLTQGMLESVAALAVERDLWVFSDEAYADFSFGMPHVSIASLSGMAERTITAFSFSKSHALAGLRVGYIAAPAEVVRVAQRVSTHTVFNVPVLMQHAAAAALAAGPRWTERALLLYRNSLEAAVAALRPTSARFSVPDGGAYIFVDFTDVLRRRPLSVLLERAVARGVLVAPGAGFGTEYASHARLCFTSEPLPRLIEGISRLSAAMRDVA
jgi:aspartate/methionine/tyrosine aminotransferase